MILSTKVMLALIQGLGGIYFENKIMATLFCSTITNTTYMRVVSMIPHSYLVHFELVQTHCLSSVLCTFLTLTIHVHDINHCSSWSIIWRLIIPLKQKEKQVKWVIVLINPCSKKREKKRRGEDDKSKSIDDGQVSLFTHAHGQSIWMAWLLRDILFELAR